MPDPGVVFDRQSARLIAETVRRIERLPTDLTAAYVPDERHNDTYVVKVDADGVTARSGTTLGEGTVKLWYIVSGELTESADERDVYNRSMLPVPPNTYVEAKIIGGYLFVTPPPGLLGKADGAIAKGANGTVSIWVGTGGAKTDSTMNVTAYNNFADVASGAWVALSEDGQEVFLLATECI